MSTRQRIRKAMAVLPLLFSGTARAEPATPNLVFIIVDDQMRHQCNFFPEGRDRQGRPTNLSPNLDSLAERGVLLSGMHSCSPVCNPSRFSVLTGTYPSRAINRVMRNTLQNYGQTHVRQSAFIIPENDTLPKQLQQLGYFTGAIGKNHVIKAEDWVHIDYRKKVSDPGVQEQLLKNDEALRKAFLSAGFDFADRLYNTNANANGPGELSHHNMEWITEGALEFIDQAVAQERPFFLYFATTLPHTPLMGYRGNPLATPIGFLDEVPDIMPPRHTIDERLQAAGISERKGDILWLDDGLGALMDKLEETGVLENTVIVYFNDHGVEAGKTSLYQGGMLTFAIVDGPEGLIQGGRKTDALCSSVDIPYTLLSMVGGDSATMKQDAVDLSPLLDGSTTSVRDFVYGELGATRAIRTEEWKYIAFREPRHMTEMSLERRKEILERYNRHRQSVGREVWDVDPMSPFPHMSFIPGGDDVEQRVMARHPHYFDPDQLYHLGNDPDEQVNLAELPEYSEVLDRMQGKLRQVLYTLPGPFAELKPSE